MKNKELIELLQEEDPEAEVHFSYSFGDHWKTIVAPKVGKVEEGRVIQSDYHRMPKIIDDDDKRFSEAEVVVIISA